MFRSGNETEATQAENWKKSQKKGRHGVLWMRKFIEKCMA